MAEKDQNKNQNGSQEDKQNPIGGQKSFTSSYPKGVRVIAMVGAVVLVLMYVVTLIAALTTSPASPGLFKACLGASILFPLVLWGYVVIARLLSGKKE